MTGNGTKSGVPMFTNSRDIKHRLEKEGWVLERIADHTTSSNILNRLKR
jgi:hypothetical protein